MLGQKSIRQDSASLRAIKRVDWNRDQYAKAHSGPVKCLRYTSCGRHIISSANDGRIRLWQSSDGKLMHINYNSSCNTPLSYNFELARFDRGLDDVLMFPNGPDGTISLTPVYSRDGMHTKELRGHLSMVNSIVFRRTFQQIISCGRDSMIHLWSCPLPPQLATNGRKSSTYDGATAGNQIGDEIDSDHDNWSDDDQIIDDMAPKRSHRKRSRHSLTRETEGPDRRLQFFTPPIIQRYLNDIYSSDGAGAAMIESSTRNQEITTQTGSSAISSHAETDTNEDPDALNTNTEPERHPKQEKASKSKQLGINYLRNKYGSKKTQMRR